METGSGARPATWVSFVEQDGGRQGLLYDDRTQDVAVFNATGVKAWNCLDGLSLADAATKYASLVVSQSSREDFEEFVARCVGKGWLVSDEAIK